MLDLETSGVYLNTIPYFTQIVFENVFSIIASNAFLTKPWDQALSTLRHILCKLICFKFRKLFINLLVYFFFFFLLQKYTECVYS